MKDRDVGVYAVWLPILGIDSKASMPMATKRFSDRRVHQYWDANAELSRSFASVLKTNEVVWDVYMLFDHDAEWKDIPPTPVYIMDKIGLEIARPLDGAELAKQLEALKSVPTKKR